MSSPEEDEAWRAIVEHYGERPRVDDVPEPGHTEAAGPEPATPGPERPADEPAPFPGDLTDDLRDDEPGPSGPSAADDREDRFVPPPPPPIPRARPLRLAAWSGLLGAPVALVLLAMLSVSPPLVVPLLLAIAFVGGFLYLVATMDRGPRDPWDDGAAL